MSKSSARQRFTARGSTLGIALAAIPYGARGQETPSAAPIPAAPLTEIEPADTPEARPAPLHIVSFDIGQAPGITAARPEPGKRPAWRTSFGAEIRTGPKRVMPALDLDADVVLLQGVTSMREVRRLFPARAWKLVVSRQLLGSDDPLDPWTRDAVASVPATAVAVRYQRGLRVTGQDHLLEMAADAGSGSKTPPAATAVRLARRGTVLWVISAALTPDCAANPLTCAAYGSLQSWREARRSAGEPTIAGGRIAGGKADAACAGQAIDGGDLEPGRDGGHAPSERHGVAGCVARLALAP